MKDTLPLLEPVKSYKMVTALPGSALDAAQQHLRDSQEEPILDFDSALRRLSEEQARLVFINRSYFFYGSFGC